ncbi:MAG: hypothetical protein KGM47_05275 [Acidobacteriota bacterium]|nr:hypothetical protein [Acidobacteriota bacterium]
MEFANCRPEPEAFERFKARWERVDPRLKWSGENKDFLRTQRILREVWEGRKKGIEGVQVAASLGLEIGPNGHWADEGEYVPPQPLAVDWEAGSLFVIPQSLHDIVWLTLLQHSRQLAICANYRNDATNGCQTPYFIRYRPRQKFCSDACALPSQRAFKRDWWSKHGEEWNRKRKRQRRAKPGSGAGAFAGGRPSGKRARRKER